MAEMRVAVEGISQVSGTVTTVPSGTQNVAVTGQPISTNATIVGQPIGTYTVSSPNVTGTYVFSLAGAAGVVASNNFMSIFNPVGSGKTVVYGASYISCSLAAGSTETAPLRGFRVTAASAGTLQATSAISKFQTSFANPVAEIRTGNPTVTTGAALFNFPSTVLNAAGSGITQTVVPPSNAQPFIMAPGEGVVFNTSAGDVDQRWNISIVWAEI